MREKFLARAFRLSDKDHIRVETGSHDLTRVIPHSFDSIVLQPDVRNRIVNGLTNWYNSKQWYKDHELVHKIGILLYGDPGTGKSTLAKAISNMFGNCPIITFGSKSSDIMGDILYMRKSHAGVFIVLIEDFDMIFTKRDEGDEDDEKSKKKDLSQNMIFQILDGLYSTEDTIYIATTNYIKNIDPALIRYGRFDIQEELKFFSKEQALECTKLLGYDQKVLDSLNLQYPVQPSYLQSRIMDYRAECMRNNIL